MRAERAHLANVECVFVLFVLPCSDNDGDEEFDDDKISRIVVVTQPPYLKKHPSGDRTGNFTSRPKVTSELANVINEGLFQYEKVRCKGGERGDGEV